MAELIEIKRVLIGPENMTASVRLADDAPIMTSEDLEGTTYVYRLLPHIVEHKVEDAEGGIFREVMGSTNLADLLAHVTIELLGQTRLLEEPPAVRTWANGARGRAYKIEIACPDDVLVVTALSCGAWIMDWAYRGASDPDPDIDAIVAGLVQLVENVGNEGEDLVVDYDAPKPPEEASEPEDEAAPVDELDAETLEEEGDAGYTGQIDFSKQYVFGKQRSYEEDADAEEEGADIDAADTEEAIADEEADIKQDAATEEEPAEEEPVEEPQPLWTEAPDLSERVAISERAAALEAEINRFMESVRIDAGLLSAKQAVPAEEPVAQAADAGAPVASDEAEGDVEPTAEVDKPVASGAPEEPAAQASDAEVPASAGLAEDDARIEAEIDRLMASIEALRDALSKNAR